MVALFERPFRTTFSSESKVPNSKLNNPPHQRVQKSPHQVGLTNCSSNENFRLTQSPDVVLHLFQEGYKKRSKIRLSDLNKVSIGSFIFSLVDSEWLTGGVRWLNWLDCTCLVSWLQTGKIAQCSENKRLGILHFSYTSNQFISNQCSAP